LSKNIDSFEQYFSEYLVDLYEAFPLPIDFITISPDLDDYSWQRLLYRGENHYKDEGEKLKNDISAYKKRCESNIAETNIRTATVNWLFETGYFTGDRTENHRDLLFEYIDEHGEFINQYDLTGSKMFSVYSESYGDARLSAKGLAVLHSIPVSIAMHDNEKPASFGDKLSKHVKEAAGELRQQSIKRIVGETIGYAVKAMST